MLLRLILLLLLPLTTLAQRYPIQATVTLTPPYSPYLTDLTAPGAQRMALYLHVTDPTLSDYTCKLRLTIEGVGITLRTRPSFQPIAILLQGGVPHTLYGEDLLDYLNPANLDFAGLSRSAFAQTHRLPEGVYRFSIEVLDYNRGTVVSNKATATAWIILNDPPLLNLPRTNTKLAVFDPTNIPFTWTPRHTASPNAAFTTEYIFRLFELPATSPEPLAASSQLSAGSSQLLTAANQAVLSQLPLYETTLAQSQLVYGPGEPALIPGRWYAWQVQAIDTEERDLFKNRGKSEVFVFQFGDSINMPGNVRKETANHQVISIRWDVPTQGDMPEQYRVLYKPTFNDHWYEDVTKERWHNIGYLKPNTTYDIKVRSEKGKQQSEYTTTIQAATTDESSKFQCGGEVNIQPIDLSAAPLPHLLPGDRIVLNDFSVLVIKATGSNGYFEGTGWAKIPAFNGASVKIKFNGKINMLYQVDGEGETISTGGNWASNLIDDMEKIGEERRKEEAKIAAAATLPVTITLTGEIAAVTINPAGDIVITKTDGTTETKTHPTDEKTKEKKTLILVDEKQNQYTISKEGVITKGAPGSGTNGTVTAQQAEKNAIKEKILRLILAEFKTEIDAWLSEHGKGPLDDEILALIMALPGCFPQDEDVLQHIRDNIIPYYENEANTHELREKIEANPSNKELLDNIANPFGSVNDVEFNKVPEGDREAARNMMCVAVVEADVASLETELISKIGTDKKGTNCFAQGWERAEQVYGKYDFSTAAYAGFIRYLVCETEKENCGSGELSSFSCGITNGLLQELDWVVLLEGEGITEEDIVKLILCVKDEYPIGGRAEDNPDLYKILFKCITGVELGDLSDAIGDFITENWDEPYYQGQATAFVVTLLSPLKAKIIDKLRTLPKYAGKITKIEALSRASKATELVDYSNTLVRYGDEVADITTSLIKTGDDFTVLSNARKLPGTVAGNGKTITGTWLRGTERNAGLFPKSVADKLKGKQFKNFDEFRQTFWREVANDPGLSSKFDPQSIQRMQNGFAPFTDVTQQLGGQKNFILHHKTPINQGGAVYDMDNLYIVTPKYHKEILDPAYHFGYGY